MKTKLIVQNGISEIILTPENEFEKDLLEKFKKNDKDYDYDLMINAEYKNYDYENHSINIKITKK